MENSRPCYILDNYNQHFWVILDMLICAISATWMENSRHCWIFRGVSPQKIFIGRRGGIPDLRRVLRAGPAPRQALRQDPQI